MQKLRNVVYFSTFYHDLQNIKKIIFQEERDSNNIVICSNYNVFLEAKELGLNAKLSSKYYDHSQDEKEYKEASLMSQKWFKKLANFQFKNYSLAEISALPMEHYFAEYLRGKNIVKNILEIEKPDLVYTSFDFVITPLQRWVTENFTLENMVLKEECLKLNIYVKKLPQPFLFPKITLPFISIITFNSIKNLLATKIHPRQILFFAHSHQLSNILTLFTEATKNKLDYYIVSKNANSHQDLLLFSKFISLRGVFIYIYYYFLCFLFSLKVKNQLASFSSILTKKINFTIRSEYPKIILQICQSQNIIKTVKPKVIISAASTDVLDQALVRTAQFNKIPTIVPQHGIATRNEQDYYLGDIIPVWGKISSQIFIKYGQNPKKVRVAGYPLFDKYHRHQKTLKPKRNLIVFLATSPLGSEKLFCRQTQEEIYAELIKALKTIPNYRAIIRPHPGASTNSLYELAHKMDYDLINHNNYSLDETLAMADFIITQPTTPGLEAIVLNKKVLFYQHLAQLRSEFQYFRKTGPILHSFSNLEETLKNTVWNKYETGRKDFITNYFCRLDGKASQRIIDLVYNLLKTRVTNPVSKP